jgi:hypothetical protein
VGGDTDFSISGNYFGNHVSLAGQPAPDLTTDVTFFGNHVRGHLGVMNASRVLITGNDIAYLAKDAEAAVSIRASTDVVMTGNVVRRAEGSTPGPVLVVNGSNGKFSGGILVDGNVLGAGSGAGSGAVELESVEDVTLSDNSMGAVLVKGTGREVNRVLIQGNRGATLRCANAKAVTHDVAGATGCKP